MSLICLGIAIIGIICYFKYRKSIAKLNLWKRVICDILLVFCIVMCAFALVTGAGIIIIVGLIYGFFMLGEAVTGRDWGFGSSLIESINNLAVIIVIGLGILAIWVIKKLLYKKSKQVDTISEMNSENNIEETDVISKPEKKENGNYNE